MMLDRESPLDGNMSGYSMESLTVAHSGQHIWTVPHSLQAKDIFCRFRKKRVGALYCSHYKRQNLCSYPTLHTFSAAVKSLTWMTHPLPNFYISGADPCISHEIPQKFLRLPLLSAICLSTPLPQLEILHPPLYISYSFYKF